MVESNKKGCNHRFSFPLTPMYGYKLMMMVVA